MGCGSWSASSWSTYKKTRGVTEESTMKDIYRSSGMKDYLNPKGITYRESCDSTEHPNSTAVIVGLDVTGSMGYLAEEIAKNSLNKLFLEILEKKPVEDPQIMFMAIGDTYYDHAPLQVSQFESDIRVAEQLSDIYFEGGGGPNPGESYLAAWYFAARHTKIDCYDKHKKKGFLFTIGDEPNLPILSKEHILRFLGDDVNSDISAEELLKEVSRQYEVFHLCVGRSEGRIEQAYPGWAKLLGQRAMKVKDHTKIPEVIESTMEVISGVDAKTAAGKWSGDTSLVVMDAIHGLANVKDSGDLVEF